MKNRKRLLVCMTAGVLILAVSAMAAFGSVNGYGKYKSAVMALALEEENFSASADLTMTLDGTTILTMDMEAAMAAPDYAYTLTSTQKGKTFEEYSGNVDGKHIWYTGEESYHCYDDPDGQQNVLSIDSEDEMVSRVVNFLEIAADTVVGDLKNNFVEIGKEEGSTLYQVNISNAQVPALVNAGLSLFAYTLAEEQNDVRYITYEDPNEVMFAYYESVTGETLSQDFREGYRTWTDEWYQDNQAMVERFESVCYKEGSWSEPYDKVLEEAGGGIVYVYADGTFAYYPDGFAYSQAHGEPLDDIYYYVGRDMILDSIDCVFGVDEADRLTSNGITVTFTTTDMDGQHHQLVMVVDLTVFDYGATQVEAPDLTGRTQV